MLSGLNRPTPNAGPNSEVIKQAIDLCAAFGNGNPALIDLLQDMLHIQTKNEDVLRDASERYNKVHETYLKLEDGIEKFGKRIKEEEAKWSQNNADLKIREDRLETSIETNKNLELQRKEAHAKRDTGLSDWEAKIEQKQKDANMGLAEVEAGKLVNKTNAILISNREKRLHLTVGKLKVIFEDL